MTDFSTALYGLATVIFLVAITIGIFGSFISGVARAWERGRLSAREESRLENK